MPEELPEFETDEELVEWFERANLSEYQLDAVLGWTVAEQVRLTIEEPWASDRADTASGGATVDLQVDDSLLPAIR